MRSIDYQIYGSGLSWSGRFLKKLLVLFVFTLAFYSKLVSPRVSFRVVVGRVAACSKSPKSSCVFSSLGLRRNRIVVVFSSIAISNRCCCCVMVLRSYRRVVKVCCVENILGSMSSACLLVPRLASIRFAFLWLL